MDRDSPDPFRDNDWRSQASGAAGLYGELPALPMRRPVGDAPVREPEPKTLETD